MPRHARVASPASWWWPSASHGRGVAGTARVARLRARQMNTVIFTARDFR
jgi:hypothetical protein